MNKVVHASFSFVPPPLPPLHLVHRIRLFSFSPTTGKHINRLFFTSSVPVFLHDWHAENHWQFNPGDMPKFWGPQMGVPQVDHGQFSPGQPAPDDGRGCPANEGHVDMWKPTQGWCVEHSCYNPISQLTIHRYIGLHLSFLPLPFTHCCITYDLISLTWPLYNINLLTTATTTMSIRGVQIPICLPSGTTDFIRPPLAVLKMYQ